MTLRHILLVDDEADIRFIASLALRAVGFEVRLASTGREGLAAAVGEAPDLIVLDSMMPGMDGLATLSALRAAGVHVPVVFMTANTDLEDLARYRAAGAIGVVPKPFDVKRLGDQLRKIFAAH